MKKRKKGENMEIEEMYR